MQQVREVFRQRRLEQQWPPIRRMVEAEPVRVQRLALEWNRAQRIRAVHVPLLSDERVPAQPRLNADLVALAGLQAHLDQRGVAERIRARDSRDTASMPRGSFGCVSFWMSAF